MFHKQAICLAVTLCFAVTIIYSQGVDTAITKLTNFPTKLFGKIQSQSTELNQQITRQTTGYLTRMARLEQRLQQSVAAVDPQAASALFSNARQQYAALALALKGDTTRRAVPLRGQYIPAVDTLQGALSFLSQHAQVLTKAGQLSPQVESHLQAASNQFQLVQAKMQDADAAKAFVLSRQQQISQYFAQHTQYLGLAGKYLNGMQQESYYFSQRVRQYKEMLSDPSALAQTALAMLTRLSTFQSFMKTHSQLGSLFQMPGNYSSPAALNGLQTKAQVAQSVQSQISAAGSSGATALQSQLQSAQSQLDSYKDKLSKLGMGNGEGQLPDFEPNDQKTKAFLKRLQFGFNFQTTSVTNYYPALLSLGLSLGYKLGHSNVVGVGAAYELGTGSGIRDVHLTNQGLALRSFVNIKIKGSFSLTGGVEYTYTTPFVSYQQLKQLQYWQKAGLLGVTKTISTNTKVLKQTTISLLWNCLSYYQSPPTSPIILRMGYTL